MAAETILLCPHQDRPFRDLKIVSTYRLRACEVCVYDLLVSLTNSHPSMKEGSNASKV